MPSLSRTTALSLLSLATLAATGASAQVFTPGLFGGATSAAGAASLEPDRWYVWYSRTQAAAQADADGALQAWTGNLAGLAADSLASAAAASKSATAGASLTATTLHAGAVAQDSFDAGSTLTAGLAFASIGYIAFLDTTAPLRLDLHLTGSLAITGDRNRTLPDPTRAGVAAVAVGSLNGGDNAAYLGLFRSIGISDPLAEGDALVAQLATWPTTDWLVPPQQPHIASVGLTVLAEPVDNPTTVERSFSVFAAGTPVVCPPDVVLAVCGKQMFSFQLSLVAGTQNGGIADFSHSLSVEALHLPADQTLRFADGQAIPLVTTPVPEPSTWALCLGGLAALAGWRRRKAAAQLRIL